MCVCVCVCVCVCTYSQFECVDSYFYIFVKQLILIIFFKYI